MKTNSGKIAAALLVASTFVATSTLAQNLEYANYLPPTHPSNVYALGPMFKELAEESGGSLNITLRPGGAVAGAKDTLSAIQTGLVDGGLIVSIYVPNEIPLNATMSDLALLMEDPITMMGAFSETVLLGCPACLEEFQAHNVTYLGTYATTQYDLMCNKPVATLADIQGLKIRSAGDSYGRWISKMGAVPVSVVNAEAYEAMQRGQLDCIHGSIGWMQSMSLWDVSKNVLHQQMGAYGGGALLAFNSDTWNRLSDEARAMIMKRVPAALARMAVGYIADDEEVLTKAADHGVTINGKDPEIAALLAEYQKSEIKAAVTKATQRGVKNAQKLADTFVANIAKWKAISKETGRDVALVEEALRREIYSKLGN